MLLASKSRRHTSLLTSLLTNRALEAVQDGAPHQHLHGDVSSVLSRDLRVDERAKRKLAVERVKPDQ